MSFEYFFLVRRNNKFSNESDVSNEAMNFDMKVMSFLLLI